jgi:hypothetical protein
MNGGRAPAPSSTYGEHPLPADLAAAVALGGDHAVATT